MKIIASMMILSCSLLTGSSHANVSLTQETSAPIHKKINLNTASVTDLLHVVKGIGQKRAQAIILYRQKHGQFRNITDLASVKGLGLRFVQTHRSELDAKLVC